MSLPLRNAAFAARSESFLRAGVLDDADVLVVDAVAPRFGEADPDVLVGLALAAGAWRAGDVGVDLRQIGRRAHDPDVGNGAVVEWPADLVAWEARVLASPAVGGPDAPTRPFGSQRLRDGRTLLMARRMWREQERLAAGLLALAKTPPEPRLDDATVEAWIPRLIPEDPNGMAARSVRMAARGRLTVVTGGPGCGKTWSIKRLLALLLATRAPGERPLRVVLAAPSGKAAVRMAEALGEDIDALDVPEDVRSALLALEPRTLHKLLGMRPGSPPRHDAANPLPADVVVVDEVSMIDLVALRRLVDAVMPGARLVLLGDRDQLASVQAGTVLADLVAGALADRPGPLASSVVRFQKSWRTKDAPALGTVMEAIQSATPDGLARAVRLLAGEETVPDPVARIVALGPPSEGPSGISVPTREQLAALAQPYLDGYAKEVVGRARMGEAEHLRALGAFAGYRVLAVHRRGPLGVEGLERALAERVRGAIGGAVRGAWWAGQPVLVTENAYDVELWNGDVGLVLPDDRGELVAVFPVAGGRRTVPLSRLPANSGALAMTVHKAQGSQFRHVALVLAGRESPIQTRELVYTGVTRASERLTWLGGREELAGALARPVARLSGLEEMVWP